VGTLPFSTNYWSPLRAYVGKWGGGMWGSNPP